MRGGNSDSNTGTRWECSWAGGWGGGGDAWWVKRIYANIDTPQGKISAVPGQISKGALGGLQLKPRNGW